MVKTRIGELARRKGHEKARHFQLDAGISSSMAARLFNDRVGGLELGTIDFLCDYFGVEPGELFVREPTASPKPGVRRAGRGHGNKQKGGPGGRN